MDLKVQDLLFTTSAMKPRSILLLVLFLLLQVFSTSHCLQVHQTPNVNITVIGTVFCDTCSKNTFTKHSYFLQGAKVQVKCSFKANSASKNEILITVDRTTDRFGIYKLDIPPVAGFECREGREIESFCQARLIESSSTMCNVPGLSSSAEHLALKFSQSNLCIYNLNALNYRPSKKDAVICGANNKRAAISNTLNSSLFFWPPFPPFTSWHLPSWPFPFPCPFPKLPLPNPPSFPFPFPFPLTFSPPPPALPFPFPPLGPIPPIPFPFRPPPPPPSYPFPLPPLPPFTPIPNPFTTSPPPPSPPPPTFPFPFPPLPPLGPVHVPFTPSPPPPPPSPPPPSFPFPFPPFPPVQFPPPPSPPPGFSLTDARTWFPSPFPNPPNTPNQKQDP